MIIDGVALACDISLTSTKFYNKDITGQQALLDIASSIAATAIGSKCGSNFTKAANRVLLDPKMTESLTNCISDFVSQGFTTLVDIQTDY